MGTNNTESGEKLLQAVGKKIFMVLQIFFISLLKGAMIFFFALLHRAILLEFMQTILEV